MEFLLYILAALLGYRGIRLFMKYIINWLALIVSVNPYNKKVKGIVVDLEERKSIDPREGDALSPIVEYRLEGEEELQKRLVCNKVPLDKEIFMTMFPKSFTVGDQVTVWYKTENTEDMFVQPKWEQLKLICTYLIPALFFIGSSVLGVIYAISNR